MCCLKRRSISKPGVFGDAHPTNRRHMCDARHARRKSSTEGSLGKLLQMTSASNQQLRAPCSTRFTRLTTVYPAKAGEETMALIGPVLITNSVTTRNVFTYPACSPVVMVCGRSCSFFQMIPVMLFGVLFAKKRYSLREYLSVGLITAGIVTFNLSKSQQSSKEVRAQGPALFMAGVGRRTKRRPSNISRFWLRGRSAASLPNKYSRFNGVPESTTLTVSLLGAQSVCAS